MRCLQRFCTLFVTFAIFCSLCITCFAVESDDSSNYYSFDDLENAVIVRDPAEPFTVTVVEDEASYYVRPGWAGDAVLVIGDEPPANPLFYGSGWVTGYDSNLGEVTIYFPIDSKSDHWGVDRNGYLYNVTSGSISGYLSGVYNNSVSAPSFGYPRYRTSSNSSYVNLYLMPENSNMDIAVDNVPRITPDQIYPLLLIVLVGVIFVAL